MIAIVKNPHRLDESFALSSTVWASLEKISSKEKRFELVERGSSHELSFHIDGTVNGKPFGQSISSIVTIGHDQIKATSSTPELPKLIAFVLSKLNRKTREKILDEIPTEFSENDCQLPEVSNELTFDAEKMLKRLRAAKTIKARGAVRCEYRLAKTLSRLSATSGDYSQVSCSSPALI